MRKTVISVIVAVCSLSLGAPAAARPFPDSIPLPDGFSPEGIAIGAGTTFYVGSLRDGDVYRGDLRSGSGAVLVDAPGGRVAVGLKADLAGGRLVVAGGPTGQAFLYDLRTGVDLGAVALATTPGPTFINDVALTSDAAWFTDSNRAVLYRLPLLPGGGIGTPEVLVLSGPGAALPGPFNLNGIAATPDGRTLVVVHSALASLFTVDPNTGATAAIDVGQQVPNGDGILMSGRRLWVVQNFLNQVPRDPPRARLVIGDRFGDHHQPSAADPHDGRAAWQPTGRGQRPIRPWHPRARRRRLRRRAARSMSA